MKRIIIVIAILGLTLTCKAQTTESLSNPVEVKRGFGIGFDFSFSNEPKTDNYTYPPFKIDRPIHYDYLPNVFFNFYNGSAIGLIFGIGQAKSDLFNDIHNQTEYFNSISTEIGLFYKYKLAHKFNRKLSGYIQPTLRYRKISQVTTISEDNGQLGEFLTGGQDISSVDLNLRLELSYELIKKLEVGFFVSNDIISREIVEERVAFIESSEKWILIKDYLIIGIGINYSL